jgi:hypothetical protein
LSFQKPYGDKCGLDFDPNASTSKTTPLNEGKTIFVPLACIDDIAPKVVDKGNGVFVGNRSKVERFNPPNRQPSLSNHPS